MSELILNFVADIFTRSDIIDLYFITSDLVNIPLTDNERGETAFFDTMSARIAESGVPTDKANIPIGKLVL